MLVFCGGRGENGGGRDYAFSAMPKVFISYRRTDGADYAEWIRECLESSLWHGWVVMDDYLPRFERGMPFEEQFGERLARTDVVLVLIGPGWLKATDDAGRLCLWNADDYVRVELESAFGSGAVVVPVLIGDAMMPASDQLPRTLAPFTESQVLRLPKPSVDEIVDLLEAIESEAQRPGYYRPPAHDRFDAIFGPGRGRGKPEEPSERLAILLERAVRRGVVPVGAPPAPAPPEGPRRASTSVPTYAPNAPSRRGIDRLAEGDEPAMAPPLPPPNTLAPSPKSSKPEPMPADGSYGAARRASRLWLKFGGAAVVVAVLYELARQVFGSLLSTADVRPSAARDENGDLVDCTVFAPSSAAPGESVLIQVFAHHAEQTDDARALATEFDPGTQRRAFRSLEAPVPRGALLTFELNVPGAAIAQPVETMIWRGRAQSVQFEVALPPNLAGSLFGTIWISRDGGPLGHVKFKLAVRSDARSAERLPVGDAAVHYTAAFVSYAAVDRDEVLRRVQILRALKIPHFQDLLELEPGDRWWPRLQSAIDECDLFLLFWSSSAKRSEWVRKEVLHALGRQAGDQLSPPEIRPVILDGPPLVPPWDELSHLHFNDKLLYFMSPPATAEENEMS